jgi:hypothetical protein
LLHEQFSPDAASSTRARLSDSSNALDSIMTWIDERRLPSALSSDTTSHFTSSLILQLDDALAMEHLFAVPYSPWTDGAVERAGGIAAPAARRMLGAPTAVSPLVPRARRRAARHQQLGGLSPFQVCSGGCRARRPLDVDVTSSWATAQPH